MTILRRLISRRWLLTSILVIAAMGVMVRLGIWQLDRLEQRRAFNARVQAQVDQPVLDLVDGTLDVDLVNMEYREVKVVGEYDHSHEIALRNQYWNNQWGVHLVTPLRINGTDQFVLIDRGWIPADDFKAGDWSRFAEPGLVEVQGVIRSSQSKADFGNRNDPTPSPGEAPLEAWNFINIDRIGEQVSIPLLPIYIQQAPDSSWTNLPYRSQPEVEISEGPHMGYAIQWFTFAAVLGFGYPFFIRRQDKQAKRSEESQPIQTQAPESEIKSPGSRTNPVS